MIKFISFVFSFNLMKCCPTDSNIKEDWEHDLESDIKIDENEINRLCETFKVLSNPIRLKIAYHLLKQDYCVNALVYMLHEKQNLVSHHLAIMKESGAVVSYRSSRFTYYSLNPRI